MHVFFTDTFLVQHVPNRAVTKLSCNEIFCYCLSFIKCHIIRNSRKSAQAIVITRCLGTRLPGKLLPRELPLSIITTCKITWRIASRSLPYNNFFFGYMQYIDIFQKMLNGYRHSHLFENKV